MNVSIFELRLALIESLFTLFIQSFSFIDFCSTNVSDLCDYQRQFHFFLFVNSFVSKCGKIYVKCQCRTKRFHSIFNIWIIFYAFFTFIINDKKKKKKYNFVRLPQTNCVTQVKIYFIFICV